jgi:hypothetical protein
MDKFLEHYDQLRKIGYNGRINNRKKEWFVYTTKYCHFMHSHIHLVETMLDLRDF